MPLFVDSILENSFTCESYNGFCPDFKKYFEKHKRPDNYYTLQPHPNPPIKIKGSGWYFSNYKYIVVWYDSNLHSPQKNSQMYAKVKLVNLDRPTYKSSKSDEIDNLNILYITVPINILHYFSFGSIWKDGKAIGQVPLNEFLISAEQEFNGSRDNVSYLPFYNKAEYKYNEPFSPSLYTIESDCNNYKYDQTQLIKIHHDNTDFIIHPLQLFCSHYGLSSDIKRILATYNWDEVRKRFYLDEYEDSLYAKKHVVLPKYFVKKDAIFLYHLKYSDDGIQEKVKTLNHQIKFSHEKLEPIKVPFWHNQTVQLKIRGIELNGVVLCAEITGINQPEGDDISLVLRRNKKTDKESPQSGDRSQPIVKTYKREVKTENLGNKITDGEPDNRTSQDIKKRFEELGRQRAINVVNTQSKNNNPPQIKEILPKDATELGFGEHYGEEGMVGLAVCYLDDSTENKDIKLYELWRMAKCFASLNHGQAHWFTPNLGFRVDDDLVFLSLEHDTAFAYPEIALVIRIILGKEIFYIVDFSQKSDDISMSGIVYKESDDEDFISNDDIQSSKLSEILSEVIVKEQLPTEYISQQNTAKMKITTFKHPQAESSNWVYNGISKLTHKILLK